MDVVAAGEGPPLRDLAPGGGQRAQRGASAAAAGGVRPRSWVHPQVCQPRGGAPAVRAARGQRQGRRLLQRAAAGEDPSAARGQRQRLRCCSTRNMCCIIMQFPSAALRSREKQRGQAKEDCACSRHSSSESEGQHQSLTLCKEGMLDSRGNDSRNLRPKLGGGTGTGAGSRYRLQHLDFPQTVQWLDSRRAMCVCGSHGVSFRSRRQSTPSGRNADGDGLHSDCHQPSRVLNLSTSFCV
jgi:hypothetical protein